MSGPTVSLLLPNRDNGHILDMVLGRLAENTTYPDAELIAVDDGSTDASRAILRRWRDSGAFSSFELLERPHAGVIDALNAGLSAASGELVVQLDADASLETPGWLERIVPFFLSDARIGVLSAKVAFDWGELQTCGVNVIGPEGFHGRGATITEPVGRRTYHERVARARERECAICEVTAEVDGGAGCCMMYRREVALALGGYDPGFAPVWFDDLDLTLRMRTHGLKVFYVPDVRVVHHVRTRRDAGQRAGLATMRSLSRALLPPAARHRLARRLGISLVPRAQRERLEHHYRYWREKWGFDLLNPDMEAVKRRWGNTELCWRLNPAMREAGERIIAGYGALR
jgi:glycosyltransferase involved in cell wall biosynthesis